MALVQAVVLGAEQVGDPPTRHWGELQGLKEGLVAGVVLGRRCLLCSSLLCCSLLGGSIQETLLGKAHACIDGSLIGKRCWKRGNDMGEQWQRGGGRERRKMLRWERVSQTNVCLSVIISGKASWFFVNTILVEVTDS